MSQSTNICFFNTTKFWGGGEKWHYEAAEMMSQTINNTFFVCDGNGELAAKLEEIDVIQYHIKVGNLSFLNVSKVNSLIKFYRDNKIETVIFNSPKDLKIGGKAAKKAGVSKIIYRRGIAVEVKKRRLNQYLFKNIVTHFIFNSNATKMLLEKNYMNIVPAKKSIIIYNAIEFPEGEVNYRNNAPIIIGNAGRLVEQKGQLQLINIAKKLKERDVDFRIQIAGEGPLYHVLRDEIKRQNLNTRIELLGFVDDMNSFMEQIDVFVSTATWEGFGYVIAEAMVAKKPVVAFDLSSNPELIKDGENGFLIPPNDIDLFAQKLEKLILDIDLRKKLGESAYTFSKANFEKKKQFQKLLDFMEF